MMKKAEQDDLRLSHLSLQGQARMVDVSAKVVTRRSAEAEAWVSVGAAIAARLSAAGGVDKGNVLETTRLAAVMAAKRTADLIPMCHPLALDEIAVEAHLLGSRVRVTCRVQCQGRTGVEMEAMTAVAIGALTVYDMVKSAGRGVEIGPIRLLAKAGGKSGPWVRRK